MSDWDSLIRGLQGIDWHHPSDEMLAEVGRLLKRTDDEAVLARFRNVISDNLLFDQYSPHTEYPRPLMDKFVLHMDPDDRFRVRLHKFKPEFENRGALPWIHDHRWHFVSLVLSGAYTESLYDILESDENEYAKLRLSRTVMHHHGSVNTGIPRVPHLTTNAFQEVPCYTLFVRGPSHFEYSRIFNPDSDSYKPSWGLRKELLKQCALSERCIRGGCAESPRE